MFIVILLESGDPSTRVADGVSARPLAMSDELHRKQKHRHRHKHKTEHKHKHKKEKKVSLVFLGYVTRLL